MVQGGEDCRNGVTFGSRASKPVCDKGPYVSAITLQVPDSGRSMGRDCVVLRRCLLARRVAVALYK